MLTRKKVQKYKNVHIKKTENKETANPIKQPVIKLQFQWLAIFGLSHFIFKLTLD